MIKQCVKFLKSLADNVPLVSDQPVITEPQVSEVVQVEPAVVKKPRKKKEVVADSQTTEKPKKPRKSKTDNAAQVLSDKEIANKRKEPWVDVIAFRINPDNIRNGFYELDWNSYFVIKLRQEGYGYDGDPDEEVVARWFRDICINAAVAEGVDIDESSIGTFDPSKLK